MLMTNNCIYGVSLEEALKERRGAKNMVKINADIYGGSKEVQEGILDQIKVDLYFMFKMDKRKSFTHVSLFKNTVYVTRVQVYNSMQHIDMFITEYNDKNKLTDIQLETPLLNGFYKAITK